MIDWIARAEAHLLEKWATGIDKTAEIPLSPVLSVPSERNCDKLASAFGGFVSSLQENIHHNVPGSARMTIPSAPFPISLARYLSDMAEDNVERACTSSVPASSREPMSTPGEPLALASLLALFQLETIDADEQDHMAEGYDTEEIRRVNNLAYHLITTKAWPFETAMGFVAQITPSSTLEAARVGWAHETRS
ncbi:hypothetical protein ABC383_07205 [Noviherbaspirillum sp. 1P10PC]|uniref:hypothetical protein n=1 Tax=Noviherbaspirillum sp. 1P10PC TaxID=3132292 RepID=UPI0039A379FA